MPKFAERIELNAHERLQEPGYISYPSKADCVLSAFDINRAEALALLKSHLPNEKVKALLRPTAQYVFAQHWNKFRISLRQRGLFSHTTDLSTSVKSHKFFSSVPVLEALLELDFSEHPLGGEWVYPAILQALAYVQRKDLYLWGENETRTAIFIKEYSKVTRHATPTAPIMRVDLLLTDKNTYAFERIAFLGYDYHNLPTWVGRCVIKELSDVLIPRSATEEAVFAETERLFKVQQQARQAEAAAKQKEERAEKERNDQKKAEIEGWLTALTVQAFKNLTKENNPHTQALLNSLLKDKVSEDVKRRLLFLSRLCINKLKALSACAHVLLTATEAALAETQFPANNKMAEKITLGLEDFKSKLPAELKEHMQALDLKNYSQAEFDESLEASVREGEVLIASHPPLFCEESLSSSEQAPAAMMRMTHALMHIAETLMKETQHPFFINFKKSTQFLFTTPNHAAALCHKKRLTVSYTGVNSANHAYVRMGADVYYLEMKTENYTPLGLAPEKVLAFDQAMEDHFKFAERAELTSEELKLIQNITGHKASSKHQAFLWCTLIADESQLLARLDVNAYVRVGPYLFYVDHQKQKCTRLSLTRQEIYDFDLAFERHMVRFESRPVALSYKELKIIQAITGHCEHLIDTRMVWTALLEIQANTIALALHQDYAAELPLTQKVALLPEHYQAMVVKEKARLVAFHQYFNEISTASEAEVAVDVLIEKAMHSFYQILSALKRKHGQNHAAHLKAVRRLRWELIHKVNRQNNLWANDFTVVLTREYGNLDDEILGKEERKRHAEFLAHYLGNTWQRCVLQVTEECPKDEDIQLPLGISSAYIRCRREKILLFFTKKDGRPKKETVLDRGNAEILQQFDDEFLNDRNGKIIQSLTGSKSSELNAKELQRIAVLVSSRAPLNDTDTSSRENYLAVSHPIPSYYEDIFQAQSYEDLYTASSATRGKYPWQTNWEKYDLRKDLSLIWMQDKVIWLEGDKRKQAQDAQQAQALFFAAQPKQNRWFPWFSSETDAAAAAESLKQQTAYEAAAKNFKEVKQKIAIYEQVIAYFHQAKAFAFYDLIRQRDFPIQIPVEACLINGVPVLEYLSKLELLDAQEDKEKSRQPARQNDSDDSEEDKEKKKQNNTQENEIQRNAQKYLLMMLLLHKGVPVYQKERSILP